MTLSSLTWLSIAVLTPEPAPAQAPTPTPIPTPALIPPRQFYPLPASAAPRRPQPAVPARTPLTVPSAAATADRATAERATANTGLTLYFRKSADSLVPQAGGAALLASADNPAPWTSDIPHRPIPEPEPESQPRTLGQPGAIEPPVATPRPVTAPQTTPAAPYTPPPSPRTATGPVGPVSPVNAAAAANAQKPTGGPTPPPQPSAGPTDTERYTQAPPADYVFALPNDANLEKLILDRLREEEASRPPDNEGKRPNPFDKYPKDLTFPKSSQVGGNIPYQPKTVTYAPMRAEYAALYVVHRRLHFEDRNSERYGWDLGIVQPLVSALLFYKDVLAWPQSLASGCAYGFWDTNAGKCLPGSPTPYMLYPPGLTITGSAFETVVITGAAFAFP